EPDGARATAVARVAMRLANSRANDAYYPHTLSQLRLDRPPVLMQEDAEIRLLTSLLPPSRRPEMRGGGLEALQSLIKKLEEATKQGDATETERVRKQIAATALSSPAQAPESRNRPVPMETDVVRGVEESLAFRTQVSNRIADDMATELGVTG